MHLLVFIACLVVIWALAPWWLALPLTVLALMVG